MTELFTSITFELYINGAWADISADVLKMPRPYWNTGKMSNTFDSHVGDPEIMTFSLDNSETSSGGLGYYSPGHANMRTGWRTGLDVKLSFVYDSKTYVMYYGTIKPDGINVIPGTKAERRVDITCGGFMWRASEHNLNLLSVQENKTIEEATALLIENMPIQPTATEYGTGQSTFPTVFDTAGSDTVAISELDKLALSELGWILTTDGGTLVVRGRDDLVNMSNATLPKHSNESGFLLNQTGGYLLNQTGGKIILNEVQDAVFDNVALNGSMETSYGKHYVNRVKANAYPRRVDAAATTVLWSLATPIEIPANTTITPNIRGAYNNPATSAKSVKGKDLVNPLVSGTDFTANSARNGGGSSQTANLSVTALTGAAEISIETLTNASGVSIWTGGDAGTLQVRGKGIYFDDTASNISEDTVLQADDKSIKEIEFDMKYQADPLVTKEFADFYLAMNKVKYTSVDRHTYSANRNSHNMFAFLILKPFTRARFIEDMNAVDGDFFIMGYEAEIISGKYVNWSPVVMRADDFDFTLFENGFDRITETLSTIGGFTQSSFASGGVNFGALSGETTRENGATFVSNSIVGYGSGGQLYRDTNYRISTHGALEMYAWVKMKHATALFNFSLSNTTTGTIGFSIDDATSHIYGFCDNDGSSTNTSNYTYSIDTWYKLRLFINQTGTAVDFEIYNNNDVLLWSETITTNIPATKDLDVYIESRYDANPSVANTLAYMDYFTMGYKHD